MADPRRWRIFYGMGSKRRDWLGNWISAVALWDMMTPDIFMLDSRSGKLFAVLLLEHLPVMILLRVFVLKR